MHGAITRCRAGVDRRGNYAIYRVRAKEKATPERLTGLSDRFFYPAVSPNGKTLTFVGILKSDAGNTYVNKQHISLTEITINIDDYYGIYQLDLGTKQVFRLREKTKGPGMGVSPDGKQLAYLGFGGSVADMISNPYVPTALKEMAVPGGSPSTIGTPGGGYALFAPSYSPDGRYIVYLKSKTDAPGAAAGRGRPT